MIACRQRAAVASLMVVLAGTLAGCAAGSSAPGNSGNGGSNNGASGSGGSSNGSGGAAAGSGGASAVGGAGGSAAADAAADAPPGIDGRTDAGADTGGPDAPTDATAPPCLISLIPVSAPSLSGVESGPLQFRVRAQVNQPKPLDKWVWRVTNPDHSIITPSAYAGNPTEVAFAISDPGDYLISVLLRNRDECQPPPGKLTVVPPRSAVFTVRVLPNDLRTQPPQEFTVTREQLRDGLALTAQVSTVRVDPYTEANAPLPAYLQISSADSRLTVEGNTQHGPVDIPLAADRQYDLLMIPIGDRAAPRLVSGSPGILAADQAFDPGITVGGVARRADDSAVVDARIVLRSGARPSTIGRSKEQGDFTLLTRDGPAAIDVSAPPLSGLPDLHVSASAGIVLDRNNPALTLAIRWTTTPGALKLTVRGSDGTAVVPGATVRAELTSPIAAAGRLTAHLDGSPTDSDLVLPAQGTMNAETLSDTAGVASFAMLPRGAYRVTVVPPAGAGAASAITAADVDLNAASLGREVRLARQVTLTGTLQPAAMTKGVRITAIDGGTDVVSPTVSALVGDGGRYQLTLHPGRQYKLWAVPAAGQPFARAVVDKVTPAASDTAFADAVLPRGVAFDSKVSNPRPVPDALVQVFCPESSNSCADPTLPIAEAISDVNGAFQVLLPEAGAGASVKR